MKTVFITGATGFVGSHTARLFLSEGWRVRALVRRPDRPGLLPEGTEVVPGGLSDVSRYRDALVGCDVVLHVAGLVKALTLAEYRQANALGTEALARTAAEMCPHAQFVLVSSQAAAGPAREGRPISETDLPQPVSWYGRSKLEGEQALQRFLPRPHGPSFARASSTAAATPGYSSSLRSSSAAGLPSPPAGERACNSLRLRTCAYSVRHREPY